MEAPSDALRGFVHPKAVPGGTRWPSLFLALIGLLLVACAQPEATATLTPGVIPTQPPIPTLAATPAQSFEVAPTPAPIPSPSPIAALTGTPAPTPTLKRTPTATPTATLEIPACIPSGDHTSIQNALTGPGSKAVLCPNAVFELSDTVFFTHDNQEIYTQGFPRDDSRALLRIVGKKLATAVSAESSDYVALRNVIIDGNRPQLGFAEGALINFGRGVEGRDAEGHLVEWVKAYEP